MDTTVDPIVRTVRIGDYPRVIEVMEPWWDGRILSSAPSRVFFEHFSSTCFVANVSGRLVGFLIGFFSQSHRDEAHVHYVGVHPDYRRLGIASRLCRCLFSVAVADGRAIVRSSTSPQNGRSVLFHRSLGFVLEPGNGFENGFPVRVGYPEPGESRVCFMRDLAAFAGADTAIGDLSGVCLDDVA